MAGPHPLVTQGHATRPVGPSKPKRGPKRTGQNNQAPWQQNRASAGGKR